MPVGISRLHIPLPTYFILLGLIKRFEAFSVTTVCDSLPFHHDISWRGRNLEHQYSLSIYLNRDNLAESLSIGGMLRRNRA